jgi:hypothetical protein
MIRHAITSSELDARIEKCSPGWQAEGDRRTTQFVQQGGYSEPPAPSWKKVKSVFMAIQRRKCGYCERKLTVRTIEHHVEHFRPKARVDTWPASDSAAPYDFPTGSAESSGYHALAYCPLNYLVACEHCNSGLKRNYFPIRGTRSLSDHDPASLASEEPLLIYPIGDTDTDPEQLIRFEGVLPVPSSTNASSYQYQRALVTIGLFGLVEREDLIRERAQVIALLYFALSTREDATGADSRTARSVIRTCQRAGSGHASCARSFAGLFLSHPSEAKRLAGRAIELLASLI